MPMEVQQLAEGFWRWTAPHPDWTPEKDRPGGWAQMVGCVFYEAPADSRGVRRIVLIDPLAPPEGTPDAERFWRALDRDVERVGGPVAILLGNHYHERSAQAVYERYERSPGAEIWAHEAARGEIACSLSRTFASSGQGMGADQWFELPGGVRAQEIAGLEPCEVAYYLPLQEAVVFADAVIGTGEGRVRVVPLSWAPAGAEAAMRYHESFRPSLRRLLDLPLEMLLVSHGPPVFVNGDAALAEALDAAAWGES